MSKASTMLQNTLLLTLANLAMRGVTMMFQVYLTGQVGAAGLGLLQLILTVNAFAVTVGTSGLRVAAMYLSAEEYGRDRLGGVRQAMAWCIGCGILLSAAVGLVMAATARPLALYWVKDLQAEASLRLLGLTLPLTCLSSILAGCFTACGQIGKLVTVEIADRIVSVLLTVFLLRQGVSGDLSHACVCIVAGSALASAGSIVILLGMLWNILRPHRDGSAAEQMGVRLRRLCIPVALNDYLRSGLGTLEQFLIPYGLSRSGGSRSQALADYGTIQGMVFPLMMLPSTLLFSAADVLVPELARCKARGNRHRLHRITGRCLSVSWLYACSIAGLLYVLSPALGILVYDSPEASRYLRLFAPLLPVLYLDFIVDGMHKGLGQQIYCVRVNTLTNLLDVIGLFLLLPRWGIAGYFFTYTCTHVLNFCLSLHRLLQISGVPVQLSFLLPTGGSILCAAAVVSFFVPTVPRWRNVLICGGLYLTLTALLLTLTGALDRPAEGRYNQTIPIRR